MSQTVQTQFGTGTVVDRESVRGRVSYKVEGPGFSTWVEATAMPTDFQWMPGPEDIQDNSVILPYNPAPQSWTNPTEQNIQPGQGIDPRKRTAPADSVDFQEESESYLPGPDSKLFATAGLDPEDVQAKLGPKYVNAFVEHDFTSLLARLTENPELVMSEYRERVSELVAAADQDHLERVGRNEHLEASDPHIREAAWKDVRAKAVRLRHSGQVMTRAATPDVIASQVTGDHGTYEVMVFRSNYFTGSSAVDSWSCECPWGQWAFKREHSFVGRLCSHAYATLMELQALTKSKARNPVFRNHPAIFSSRTAESIQLGDTVMHKDYTDISGVVREDSDGQYLIGEGANEYWIDHEDAVMTFEGSRTAAKLDELRPGQKVSVGGRNGRIDEIRGDRVTVAFPGEGIDFFRADQINTVLASRTAADTNLDDLQVLRFLYQFEDEGLDASASGDEQWEWAKSNIDYDMLQDAIDSAHEYGELGASQADALAYDLQQNFFGSRTAEIVDLRPVGWDPYSRNLMNRLKELWEEGSRPGLQKERNDEIRNVVDELRERGFATDGVIASLKEAKPIGDPKFQVGDEVTQIDANESASGSGTIDDMYQEHGGWFYDVIWDDGSVSSTGQAALRHGFIDRPLGYGDLPDYGTSAEYILEHELRHREDVTEPEFFYTPGTDDGVVQDINDGGGERTSNFDDYYSGDQFDGAEDPFYVDPMEREDYPEDYSGGDQFDGAEDPYYVDPAEQDDIVASFQRNAGHLLGGTEGMAGGHDDISAAAEAHLKTAGRHFTMAEQQALIDEDDGNPYDRSQLRLDGTHYL